MNLAPALMDFGRFELISPDGSHRIPPELWPELRIAMFLDHEPEELAQWIRRLEARLGVNAKHRNQLVRATILAFPGETITPRGRRVTEAPHPTDPYLDWYVARAATRQEKRAEESLIDAGFAVYLPRLVRYGRDKAGRRKRIVQPLIPGYLFVGLPGDGAVHAALDADGVHDLARNVHDRSPAPVLFEDVRGLVERELEGEFDRTRRQKEPPTRGDAVTVDAGKFQGWPAQMVELIPKERVKLLMQMFGRWTEVELKREQVAELRGDEGA